jgi:hypothetical protein
LYLLGWLAVLGGGAWAGLSLSTTIGEALRRGGAEPLPSLLALAIATPGLTTILAGLLLIAAGGVLTRLGRIARNTEDLLEEVRSRRAYMPAPTPVPTDAAAPHADPAEIVIGAKEPRL